MLIIVTLFLVLVGAIRSTWSPCGWSMLSTLTPLAESSRGRKISATYFWFILGAVAGGVSLGIVISFLALFFHLLSINIDYVAIGLGALFCFASDSNILKFLLPIHRRQVNEDWLDKYRQWVYCAGFGWQIGCGFATFITTTSLYLMVFSASMLGVRNGFLFGIIFGLIRGFAIFAGSKIDSTQKLFGFHKKFEKIGEVVRKITLLNLALVSFLLFSQRGILFMLIPTIFFSFLGVKSYISYKNKTKASNTYLERIDI